MTGKAHARHPSSPHRPCRTGSYLLPSHDFSSVHLKLMGMLCNSLSFPATAKKANHNSTLDAEILVNRFSLEPKSYPSNMSKAQILSDLLPVNTEGSTALGAAEGEHPLPLWPLPRCSSRLSACPSPSTATVVLRGKEAS